MNFGHGCCITPLRFHGILHEDYYQHHLLLVEAVFLLLQDEVGERDTEQSLRLLKHYCFMLTPLYGELILCRGELPHDSPFLAEVHPKFVVDTIGLCRKHHTYTCNSHNPIRIHFRTPSFHFMGACFHVPCDGTCIWSPHKLCTC